MSSREQLQTQVDEQFPDLDLYWYEPAPGNWVVTGDSKPLTEDQAKAVVTQSYSRSLTRRDESQSSDLRFVVPVRH